MASFCSSTLISIAKSTTFRSKLIILGAASARPSLTLLPSSAVCNSRVSRVLSVLGIAESLMPLHSAVASARLTSSIAVDSSCWSWLSLEFAVPR